MLDCAGSGWMDWRTLDGGVATSSAMRRSPMGCTGPACVSRSGPPSSTSNPADDPARGYATRWLAEVCAKGRVGRKYWLPRVALTEVLSYGEGARALAVRRAQGQGRYEQLANVQVVEQIHANGRIKLRLGAHLPGCQSSRGAAWADRVSVHAAYAAALVRAEVVIGRPAAVRGQARASGP
jgi:hypothetical protein